MAVYKDVGAGDLAGRVALVTGASSGIGRAFARQLAERGATLVITARRQAELDTLAAELRERHGTKVTVVPLDLGAPGAAEELHRRCAEQPVDVLINNAGFGTFAHFVDSDWSLLAQQLQLNVINLTELTHRFGREMVARGRGHILNVSSIGAYLPVPAFSTYAAGKAYVRNFTEALAAELAPRGVRVCCLCPGGTSTEFQQTAGQTIPAWQRFAYMSAESCARIGLAALFGRRRNVVSGWMNKIGMWLLRFLPRRLMPMIGGIAMGSPSETAKR